MSNKEKYKQIVDAVRGHLKPLGFKKSGTRFYTKTENLFHIVEFQKNKWNDELTLGFTVNLGIASSTLIEALKDISFFNVPKTPSTADCQKSFRIGSFAEPKQDLWWHINEKTCATGVAKELITLLQRALPEILKIKNDGELCDAWLKKDKSEDQNSLYRLKMLATLLTCTNRNSEAEMVIKRLREAFPRKSHKDLLDRLQMLRKSTSKDNSIA